METRLVVPLAKYIERRTGSNETMVFPKEKNIFENLVWIYTQNTRIFILILEDDI